MNTGVTPVLAPDLLSMVTIHWRLDLGLGYCGRWILVG